MNPAAPVSRIFMLSSYRGASQPPVDLICREKILDVVDHIVLLARLANAGNALVAEFLVSHGENGRIVSAVAHPLDRADAVLTLGFVAIDPRIENVNFGAVIL